MKRFISLALLAATASGCSSGTVLEDNPKPVAGQSQLSPTSENEIYQEQRLKLLRERFGADVVKYALQIIDNGSRIKGDPQKNKNILAI